jgi:hypothetical protein
LPSDALQPDPVFMNLRAIAYAGPIGAFRRWIDRRIEAREDRIQGSRIEDVIVSQKLHETLPSRVDAPRSDRDLAA